MASEPERISSVESVETAIEYLTQGQIDIRQEMRAMNAKIDRVLYAVLGIGGAILAALAIAIARDVF